MIIKKRSKPLTLQKYEALQARLPENSPHHHKVKYEVETRTRGYEGELVVDKYLKVLEQQFTILQDACLQINGAPFQMDNLIITPKTIYIIEVKNSSSHITLDTDLHQFITGEGDRSSGYNHPITQVKAQKFKLQSWLMEHNQPNVPIRYFVAISKPSTIIKVTGDPAKVSDIVLHAEQIPWKILEYENESQTQLFQHQKIGYTILRGCVEVDVDILSKHGILPTQLVGGVRCNQCNYVGMEKVRWNWICPRCGLVDRHAADRSIDEYLMLVKPWVTNRELVSYLNINSRYVVSRLLKNHPNLQYSHKRKRWEKKVNVINKGNTRQVVHGNLV